MSKPFARRVILLVIAVLISVSVVGAQTVVTAPPNKYSPSEDVQLGREAAAQAERQLPILRDDGVTSYVQSIGRRLAGAALLRDGSLFYALGVVPRAQFSDYQGTFRQVVRSIRIME